MTTNPPVRPPGSPPESETPVGLRLRLWFACLGGTLVTSGGVWWIVGTQLGPGAPADPAALVLWLIGAASLGALSGAALALWLDARIIGHLRGLGRSLASGQVQEARNLPATSGWGELSDLTQQIQGAIAGQREAARAAEELRAIRGQLEPLGRALERWIATERWEPLGLAGGPLDAAGAALDRGFAREGDVREQNQEAARLVHVELEAALEDARESVEQAEQGFVEATGLLTTLREVQRLAGELQQAFAASSLLAGVVPAVAEAYDRQRAVTAAAIEELIGASTQSLDHLARGLSRVQRIADQVHLLANRATLIALNAVVAAGRSGPRPEEMADDVKALAREVREATESTEAVAREIEREIAAAAERMKGLRERIAAKLDQAPALPALEGAGAPEDVLRLHGRVREMIQDATRKGERVSAAGERASRSAERVTRRLEEEAREIEGLVVRLSPAGDAIAGEPGPSALTEAEASPRPGPLRLLEHEEEGGDDAAGGDNAAGGNDAAGGDDTGRGGQAPRGEGA